MSYLHVVKKVRNHYWCYCILMVSVEDLSSFSPNQCRKYFPTAVEKLDQHSFRVKKKKKVRDLFFSPSYFPQALTSSSGRLYSHFNSSQPLLVMAATSNHASPCNHFVICSTLHTPTLSLEAKHLYIFFFPKKTE